MDFLFVAAFQVGEDAALAVEQVDGEFFLAFMLDGLNGRLADFAVNLFQRLECLPFHVAADAGALAAGAGLGGDGDGGRTEALADQLHQAEG